MEPHDGERRLAVSAVQIALIGLLAVGVAGLLFYAIVSRRTDDVRVKVNLPPALQTAPVAAAPRKATPAPSPTPFPTSTPAPTPIKVAAGPELVDAKIEIVWPHDNLPVSQAKMVNVTAYLMLPGKLESVPCDFNHRVRLWQGFNNQPATFVKYGTKRLLTENGQTFPVWDFNDVNVSESSATTATGRIAGINPNGADNAAGAKYYFYVTIENVNTNSHIWTHASDARTFLPSPLAPREASGQPNEMEARILVVWPHNNLPVTQATKVNISAALFHPGMTRSVDPAFDGLVRLYQALNDGPLQPVAIGKKRVVSDPGGATYPIWEFNDIDVNAARDPVNKYYFQVRVDTITTHSTIWSHGSDARTYFPNKDKIKGGCAAPPAGR